MSLTIDDKLIRTNPVYCLGKLVQVTDPKRRQTAIYRQLVEWQNDGVELRNIPELCFVKKQVLQPSRARAGVCGLLYAAEGCAFVSPLHAEQHSSWRASATLPFHPTQIRNLLESLMRRFLEETSVPEAFAFQIRDELEEASHGSSMHIAAALAVIDAASSSPSILDAACAVVSPSVGDELRPSQYIEEKLNAFGREYSRGTLLIRHAECIDKFDDIFDNVWIVEDLKQLARKLYDHSLLEPFLKRQSITPATVSMLESRLEDHSADQQFDVALNLIDRIDACVPEGTQPAVEFRISRIREDLYRHLGRQDDSLAESDKNRRLLKLNPDISCYDERVDSSCGVASSLYDAHRFEAAWEELSPWLDRVTSDSQIVAPLTRSKLLNTVGRVKVMLGHSDWAAYFQQSLRIQEFVAPQWKTRTLNYLIYGHLKRGPHEKAATFIKEALALSLDQASRDYLSFYEQELIRQSGQKAKYDPATAEGSDRYIDGFRIQAMARQRGRDDDESYSMLRTASKIIRPGGSSTSILHFLALCCDLAAASLIADENLAAKAIEDVNNYLSQASISSYRDHYGSAVEAYVRNPSVESAEHIIELTPYF